MRRVSTLAVAATVAAFVLAADGSSRGLREGGTFHVAVAAGFFSGIDPALASEPYLLRPACGALMSYPDKPPPAGLRLAPDLAASDPAVSKDSRTYTFTIRKDARFSDGSPVTARAFARGLERILNPAMQAQSASYWASLIVGGDAVLAGKATSPSGVTATGRTITFRLTKRDSGFPDSTTTICAVPPGLPADPEGAKAPLPSPAPYYVAEYVPEQRLVLQRNRFYRGQRPHHVDRIVADLGVDEGSIVDEIASGTVDWGQVTNAVWSDRTAELARRYGINKSQFFVDPSDFVRMFVLNTSRPLFRNNARLRQAVNFAVDRRALTRALGPSVATPTDHYLLGYKSRRIYPLTGPDLRTARKLAKGRTRGGKAVLYTRDSLVDLAQAQILQRELKAIGLEVEIHQFPSDLLFQKLASGRKEFDIGRIGWGNVVGPADPSLLGIFDGRTIGRPDNQNYSYFNSSKYNRLLDKASRLTGAKRYQAYDRLDGQISRDAAPAIPYAFQNSVTFVSARTGCVVRNPILDLTAVCLR
jgi:peptide/nickel transport system substrate-binding protein